MHVPCILLLKLQIRGISELLRKAADEPKLNDRNNIGQQLRAIGNKFLNAVEISAQGG